MKLLKLFAILLELSDEDQLVRQHEYDVKGEDHLRYMHYAARSVEENELAGDLYSPGHTDLGKYRCVIHVLDIRCLYSSL